MMYAYSDSTTPSPVTDGEHVWFLKAARGAAGICGKQIWQRQYKPLDAPHPSPSGTSGLGT